MLTTLILGMPVWKFILVVVFVTMAFSSAYILDCSNSVIHCKKEYKRMKIGDKYCVPYYSEKRLNKHQQGHRKYAIVTDKVESKNRFEWAVTYDVYIDDVKVGSETMKVFRNMLCFFNNWKRIDDYACILYLWGKHYKGNGWY